MLLNYHGIAAKPSANQAHYVEVLCLLQPVSDQWGSFHPQLDQSLRSSQLPEPSIVKGPFETCCRLEPEEVFFGAFTPAIPLSFFQHLVGAKTEDFVRHNWRYGRRSQIGQLGLPKNEGCSLSVPRKALKIPSGLKLVWLIKLDDEVVALVDERNNRQR